MAPAERYEILVNFSDGRAVDLLTSEGPGGSDPGMMMPMMRPRVPAGGTEVFMRFQPDPTLKADVTQLPREFAELSPPDIKSAVKWRTFELNPMRGMGPMGGPGSGIRKEVNHDQAGGSAHTMTINDRSFAMDRIDVTAQLGTAEIWEIVSTAMAHPFHVHGARFRILSNNGTKPSPQASGWKDVVLVEHRAELLVRFDNLAPPEMPFMYHCHILEHEDQGMMGQFAVI